MTSPERVIDTTEAPRPEAWIVKDHLNSHVKACSSLVRVDVGPVRLLPPNVCHQLTVN